MIKLSSVPFYLAFGAGVISFLSPCILPLVPGYISYLAGLSVDSKVQKGLIIRRAVLFNLGFILIFVLMGATGSYLGKLLLSYRTLLVKLGGIFIFIMGLQVSGLLKLQFLYKTYKLKYSPNINGSLGAFLLGIIFAAGWTPCVGPVLASILVFAGMSATLYKGMLLLGAYSLGLAVPFMLAAAGISWGVDYLPRFNRYLSLLSVVSGVILMLVGILLFLNIFQLVSAYLSF